MIDIFRIICLSLPVFVELYDDRNGDKHPNNDWLFRGITMIFFSGLFALLYHDKNVIQNLLLSFGIFAFFFPYLINIVHLKRGVIKLAPGEKWYNHLSAKAWPDNQEWWNGIPWYARLIMMGIVFLACALVYNCWGKLYVFSNAC